MKVISVLGSPRKEGTSSRIAQAFTDTMKKKGVEVERFYLNRMTYKGCQGCEKCHTKQDKCILKDDLTPVLNAMRSSDVAVFSSPVYYGDTSGQFKSFIDRTWSQVAVDYENENPYTSRLPEGKTAVFILTQGDVEAKHEDVIERYRFFFELYGYDLKVIRATSLMTGRPDENVSTAQDEAAKLAETLLVANNEES